MCKIQGCLSVQIPPTYFGAIGAGRSIYAKDKKWEVGSLLTYSLNSPNRNYQLNSKQRDLLSQVLYDLQQVANITFGLVEDWESADLRIEANQRAGNWSFVGTDVIFRTENPRTKSLATINLGDTVYYVYFHELLHAIGFLHEHQNPFGEPIDWIKDWLYNKYGGSPNYWDKATIDHNIIKLHRKDLVLGTDFDKRSIMLYPIEKESNRQGIEIGWNTKLSEGDLQGLRMAYPFPVAAIDAEVLQLMKSVFQDKRDLMSIPERLLVKFANELGIEAHVKDWKKDTAALIAGKLQILN